MIYVIILMYNLEINYLSIYQVHLHQLFYYYLQIRVSEMQLLSFVLPIIELRTFHVLRISVEYF